MKLTERDAIKSSLADSLHLVQLTYGTGVWHISFLNYISYHREHKEIKKTFELNDVKNDLYRRGFTESSLTTENHLLELTFLTWYSLCPEPTAITSPAGHLDVTVGESIVLPCQVSHDLTLELKFTWFFNEQLIHFGSHGAYFEKVGGVSAPVSSEPPSLCVYGVKHEHPLQTSVTHTSLWVEVFTWPLNSLWQNYLIFFKLRIFLSAK